jgi:choline-sulfatase
MYLLRKGRWKYIHYVGYPPELFDLESDPGETRDLGSDPNYASTVAMMEEELRKIINPEVVSAKAFADQKAKIEKNGGVAALIERGDFGYSPAPGQKPIFATTLEA